MITAKVAARSWEDETKKHLDCADRFAALKAFVIKGVEK